MHTGIEDTLGCSKGFQFLSRRRESPHWRRCRPGITPAIAWLSNTGRIPRRSRRSCRPASSLDEKSEGRAFFWFLDWQFTGSNDELTDPARYQYREAFVLVEAVFDGTPVNYCPYIFVDNDAAIARGWAQGFPKKLASVYQTRYLLRAEPGGGAACEGKSVRRQRLGAWRTAGDRPYPTGGEGRGPRDGVQPPDGDAPILSPTRSQSGRSRRSTS